MKLIKRLSNIKKALVRRFNEDPRPSIDDLDRKLDPYLDFTGGFFIEAGANNGYTQSNTYYLARQRNWRGLLVEGIPELYARCVKERPESITVHAALVAADYPHPTVTMHYADLMSVVDGSLNSDAEQAQHLRIGRDILNLDQSYTVEVPARTLESILDDIDPLPPIDFFSLDVEGYEINVLKGMNLQRYRPTYIMLEVRDPQTVDAFMTEHDYGLVEALSELDYLYRRKQAPADGRK